MEPKPGYVYMILMIRDGWVGIRISGYNTKDLINKRKPQVIYFMFFVYGTDKVGCVSFYVT